MELRGNIGKVVGFDIDYRAIISRARLDTVIIWVAGIDRDREGLIMSFTTLSIMLYVKTVFTPFTRKTGWLIPLLHW